MWGERKRMKVTQNGNVLTIEDGDAVYEVMVNGDFIHVAVAKEDEWLEGKIMTDGAAIMKRTTKEDTKPKIEIVKPRIIT